MKQELKGVKERPKWTGGRVYHVEVPFETRRRGKHGGGVGVGGVV